MLESDFTGRLFFGNSNKQQFENSAEILLGAADKGHILNTGRNRLSAESWLVGDSRLGRLNCGAGQLGCRASLQPWHSFLNRFAECAS